MVGYYYRLGSGPAPGWRDWGGGRDQKKIWGAREVYLCDFEGGRGAQEVYSSGDQTKKVKTENKKTGFEYKYFHKFWLLPQNSYEFHEFLSKYQKEKRSSSQKLYEIWCESTKITKRHFLLANSRAVNTNLEVLGLDLHSTSPEPINFFGAQTSLGGAQFSFEGAQAVIWGSMASECPQWPRAWLGFQYQTKS